MAELARQPDKTVRHQPDAQGGNGERQRRRPAERRGGGNPGDGHGKRGGHDADRHRCRLEEVKLAAQRGPAGWPLGLQLGAGVLACHGWLHPREESHPASQPPSAASTEPVMEEASAAPGIDEWFTIAPAGWARICRISARMHRHTPTALRSVTSAWITSAGGPSFRAAAAVRASPSPSISTSATFAPAAAKARALARPMPD